VIARDQLGESEVSADVSGGSDGDEVGSLEKGLVMRKIASFIGERIWSVWNLY